MFRPRAGLFEDDLAGTKLVLQGSGLSWCAEIVLFFGMAAMPFLCRDLFFTKISYHRNVSLAEYLQFSIFLFVKKILHLYKRSRLSSSLFTFFRQFSTAKKLWTKKHFNQKQEKHIIRGERGKRGESSTYIWHKIRGGSELKQMLGICNLNLILLQHGNDIMYYRVDITLVDYSVVWLNSVLRFSFYSAIWFFLIRPSGFGLMDPSLLLRIISILQWEKLQCWSKGVLARARKL